MKNYNFIGVGLCLFLTLSNFAQDLIITGIYDGPLSGGTPKGIELYVKNDIADLSSYGLGVANNGEGSDGIEFIFPIESASKGTFIYVTSNLEQFETYFGFQANFQTGNIAVNGDDAVELFYNESRIDVFGDPNTDGTDTEWEYTDGWAYRTNNNQDNTSFSVADWSFSGVNALDNTTVNTEASQPFPAGSFSGEVTTEPLISIISPATGSIAHTTSVTINLEIQNFNLSADNGNGESDGAGDGFIRFQWLEEQELLFSQNVFDTTLTNMSVNAGKTYTIIVDLVDNQGNELEPQVRESVSFTVEFPCDLVLEEPVITCQNEVEDADFYSVVLPFTGGNTGTLYSISILDETNTSIGTLEGEHPNEHSAGQISITNIPTDTAIHLIIEGDEESSCAFSMSINPPNCDLEITCPEEGALIITEIMQNPAAVSDSNGEYFEVYNTTSEPIDLIGWTISTAGSGDPVTHTISTSLIVPANQFLIFSENADTGTNGGVTVDYQYPSGLFLANGSATIKISCGENTIDQVTYDDGETFPDPNGASMELATSAYSHIENDLGENWIEATEEISNGGDLGTPGFSNANVLQASDEKRPFGFTVFPNPSYNKEIIIITDTANSKKLVIFDILGKKVLSKSIEHSKQQVNLEELEAGIYYVKVFQGTQFSTLQLIIK